MRHKCHPINSLSFKFQTPKQNVGEKDGSLKKLAKKVKSIGGGGDGEDSKYECLLRGIRANVFAADAVGVFRRLCRRGGTRFVVPTSYLSHPLFKMLLEKSYNEYGFEQRDKLVVPCSIATFREVVNAVECCMGSLILENWLRSLFKLRSNFLHSSYAWSYTCSFVCIIHMRPLLHC
ncbi:protein argonaute MEL1-like [Hibiscus syriacus]|uniref:Protein argonaute MEL1-like n=1 Tax=Hibiscus syriacus TaxID=106335 RepID=A0A6A2Y8K3_HIBSY|nr:protein argonaute MEL1-like [Hibiscus syriacus]